MLCGEPAGHDSGHAGLHKTSSPTAQSLWQACIGETRRHDKNLLDFPSGEFPTQFARTFPIDKLAQY